MRSAWNSCGLCLTILLSSLSLVAQTNGLAVVPSTGTPTYLLPDPNGITVNSNQTPGTSYGITMHVCGQCQFQTAGGPSGAVKWVANTYQNADLTLIDEVRGDNITQGIDIFQQGVNLHFTGMGSGGLFNTTTVFPYIIDYPIHVGPQESIEGLGDCSAASAIGCTGFILASTFPAGVADPTLSTEAPSLGTTSCGTQPAPPTGNYIASMSLVTPSGSTRQSMLSSKVPSGGSCLLITPSTMFPAPTGDSWAFFISFCTMPSTCTPAAPRWQATIPDSPTPPSSYTVTGMPRSTGNPNGILTSSNPAPTFNLSQVGITLGASNDLAGNLSLGVLARDFALDGNGSQTCIAVTTAQNQSVLSNVNVGNCGSVTLSSNTFDCTTGLGTGTTPLFCTAAIVYEGFNGAVGPTAFPTRDITVFSSTCNGGTSPCSLANGGAGESQAMLPNYCILVDGALNPAPFTNVAFPCAANYPPSSMRALPKPFVAFELNNPTSANLKAEIDGLHVEATNKFGTKPTFNGLQNDGYNLHIAGADCSQGTISAPGKCVEQMSGTLSSQTIVPGGLPATQTIALEDNNNMSAVSYTAGQVSTGYSTNGPGNYDSPDFPLAVSRLPVHAVNVDSTTAPTSMNNPLFTVQAASDAQFVLFASVNCNATMMGVSAAVSLGYTDPSGTAQTVSGTAAMCTTLGSGSVASLSRVFRAEKNTGVTYTVQVSGTASGLGYGYSVTVLQLSTN